MLYISLWCVYGLCTVYFGLRVSFPPPHTHTHTHAHTHNTHMHTHAHTHTTHTCTHNTHAHTTHMHTHAQHTRTHTHTHTHTHTYTHTQHGRHKMTFPQFVSNLQQIRVSLPKDMLKVCNSVKSIIQRILYLNTIQYNTCLTLEIEAGYAMPPAKIVRYMYHVPLQLDP